MIAERIDGVKTKEGKIIIAFETPIDDEFEGKYWDAPRPEFQTAFQAVKWPALEWLELPKDYGETMAVTGIRYTWAEGVMGCVVTMQKQLQKALPGP